MTVIYRISPGRIQGGPDWFSTAVFDLEAKADRAYGLDDLHTMFKNLLADRFGLKFHTETKQGPVYELMVDRSGAKMKADGDVGNLNIPIIPSGPGEFVGTKVPIAYLCWFLGQQMQNDPRPVIDRTGLTQVYDFTFNFMPELPPGVSIDALPPEMQNRPTIMDALREQLGLRLGNTEGPRGELCDRPCGQAVGELADDSAHSEKFLDFLEETKEAVTERACIATRPFEQDLRRSDSISPAACDFSERPSRSFAICGQPP